VGASECQLDGVAVVVALAVSALETGCFSIPKSALNSPRSIWPPAVSGAVNVAWLMAWTVRRTLPGRRYARASGGTVLLPIVAGIFSQLRFTRRCLDPVLALVAKRMVTREKPVPVQFKVKARVPTAGVSPVRHGEWRSCWKPENGPTWLPPFPVSV
jgi:hypothetical protein